MGVKGAWQEVSWMKICRMDNLQIYVKFPMTIFNSNKLDLATAESP